MNYINKVDEYCNYKFLVEFTNQPYLSEYEFTIEGSELKFAGYSMEAALKLFPELPHITQDSAPHHREDRMAVKIDMLGNDYIVVYLQRGFDFLPFEILDRYGRDTISDETKKEYFSSIPLNFVNNYKSN